MTEVTVKPGRHPDDVGRDITGAKDARVGTPSERRRHPVIVVETDRPDPVNVGQVTKSVSRVPANLDRVTDDELMTLLVEAAEAGHDSDAQRVWDEIGLREDAAAAALKYRLPKPVTEMSDDELDDAARLAAADESILVQVLDEMDVRQEAADRRREEAARPPTEPAMVAWPMTAWLDLAGSPLAGASTADDVTKERASRALRLSYGLDPAAPDTELNEALRNDGRAYDLKIAWQLAWYRKLALAEGVDPGDKQQFGPPDTLEGRRFIESVQASAAAADRAKAAKAAEAEAADRARAERNAALDANDPAPVLVRAPTVALFDVGSMARSYRDEAALARLLDARRRTVGLPVGASEKDIAAAEKADPRSPHERAAKVLGWYRYAAQLDRVPADAEEWKRGPSNDGTPIRPGIMPANVAKPWETWQDIKMQAEEDRDHGGDPRAFERYVMAIRHGLGLPDNAHHGEITRAFGMHPGNDNQRAALFIAALRRIAEADGVDKSDTLRYGPLDKGSGGRRSASHWRESTPDQDRRLDELLAKGWDYVDAYAEVHQLDPEQVRSEQGKAAVDRRAGEQLDKAVRRQYDEWVHLQHAAAEKATRGHMLSRAGIAAGIDPVSLFSGPTDRARKHASEDLLRWWDENDGRMTFTAFRAQVLGRGADKAAAKVTARRGAGKDFG